jgi:hypothetical protein
MSKETTDPKIAAAEAKLQAKYGKKIVTGSVRRPRTKAEKETYGTKLLVDINTVGVDGKPDGKTRTVATSDVFQIHHQPEVKAELAKLQRQEKSKAKEPTKKAKKATKKAKKDEGKTASQLAAELQEKANA